MKRGVLTQLSVGSLLGRYGRKTKKTAIFLLKQGLIHVIASDVHSLNNKKQFDLSSGVAMVSNIIGEEKTKKMVRDVPGKILRGESVNISSPKPFKKKLTVFGSVLKYW